MRKVVFGATVAMGAAVAVVLAAGLRSDARPLQQRSGFRVAQSSDVLTPSLGGVGRRPDYVGIVSAFDGQALDVRLSDSTTRTFIFPDNLGGSPPNLQVGQTIAFDANRNDEIEGLDIPAVERQFEGQISNVGSDQISVITSAGETVDVPVTPATISELELSNGDELKVTRFRDFPEAAGICKLKRAAFVPPPVPTPAPIPVAPPVPIPPVPQPLPALW